MSTYREAVRRQLEDLSLEGKASAEVERELITAAVLAMLHAGFTLRMACEALGVPDSTVRGWAARTPALAQDIEFARERTQGRLIGVLWQQLEGEGKAAGQAANILSHLNFPELRERKVEQTITSGPDPDRARANLDAILDRGK